MTTRRRHTTRTLAAALLMGLLATPWGTAHASFAQAQTPALRYQIHAKGLTARYEGALTWQYGAKAYVYGLDFPYLHWRSNGYTVYDNIRSTDLAAKINGDNYAVSAAGDNLVYNRHKNGLWLAVSRDAAGCFIDAGGFYRQHAFDVSLLDHDVSGNCIGGMRAARVAFAALLSGIGWHGAVHIEFPPQVAHATAAPPPAPTATPVTSPSGVTYQGVTTTCPKIYADSDGMFPPKAGNEYVVAHIVMVNNSDQNQAYNTLDFQLEDASNVRYSAFAMDSNISDHTLGSGTLAPGETVAGDIAFEVPSSTGKVWLRWTPDFMAPAQYVPLH